ncbi:MAG: divalent metal cation transporter [bacterium]|nr:divalent metal cation transporter [bacterium]
MTDPASSGKRCTTSRGFGPALIVAAVVLGPGSILASSRVGADFGFAFVWVVVLAALAMIGQVALAARSGASLDGSPCDELARGLGRPAAGLVGIVVFLIVACFQFGNNVAIVAGLRPLFGVSDGVAFGLVVVWNLALAGVILGTRRLYRSLELFLRALVLAMVVAFVGNLVLARPSVSAFAHGLLPSVPEGFEGGAVGVLGLVGTTFSVAAAFYQGYLVREKGWGPDDLRRSLADSAVGISVLALLTLIIMATAATVLHGSIGGDELQSIADVARLLEPLLGEQAKVLFCLGLIAGALSSCLVNVMIGGTVLSDAFGLGARLDEPWPRRLTVVALMTGMVVALVVLQTGQRPVGLILFAQAVTVIGNPLLAGAILWLAMRPLAGGDRVAPPAMLVAGWLGFLLAVGLAIRTVLVLS